MANRPYKKGLDSLFRGHIDWINQAAFAMLVDLNDYVPNTDTHQFLADIPSVARVQTVALSGKTTDGLATIDAADPTFANATGDTSEALVIYCTDVAGTNNRLLMFYDSAPGLPVTPNTGDILVQLSASGILTIS